VPLMQCPKCGTYALVDSDGSLKAHRKPDPDNPGEFVDCDYQGAAH
jgi:hypothetical protein